jgi:ketosteroid isomerase-like protein
VSLLSARAGSAGAARAASTAAVGRKSDVHFDQPAGVLFTVKDGRIVQIQAFTSHADVLTALGLPAT